MRRREEAWRSEILYAHLRCKKREMKRRGQECNYALIITMQLIIKRKLRFEIQKNKNKSKRINLDAHHMLN